MKTILSLFTLLVLAFGCKNETTNSSEEINTETKQNEFAIIIHGGAGTILKENMSDELEAEYKEKLEEAVKVGYTILKNGGTSQDAVLKTIQVMEESPLFNAG
jgi:beta-aspartyl-peptidase (threonine type)